MQVRRHFWNVGYGGSNIADTMKTEPLPPKRHICEPTNSSLFYVTTPHCACGALWMADGDNSGWIYKNSYRDSFAMALIKKWHAWRGRG